MCSCLSHFLMAVTAEEGFGLALGFKSQHRRRRGGGRSRQLTTLQREVGPGAQLIFLFSFSTGPQPMGDATHIQDPSLPVNPLYKVLIDTLKVYLEGLGVS